jgi:hypothetical protein
LAHLGKLGGRIKGGYRAQVFEDRSIDFYKGVIFPEWMNGMEEMNTLDLP